MLYIGFGEMSSTLEGLVLDRATLQTEGLDKQKQDALLRSLFVYSHGVHNIE